MTLKKTDVTRFLKDYAAALSVADLKAVGKAWHTPSLVVDGRGSIAVTKTKQVEDFFGRAVAAYRKAGTPGLRLESAEIVRLTRQVVHATVTWRGLRDDGRPAKAERSFYVISKQGLLGRIGFDLATSIG